MTDSRQSTLPSSSKRAEMMDSARFWAGKRTQLSISAMTKRENNDRCR